MLLLQNVFSQLPCSGRVIYLKCVSSSEEPHTPVIITFHDNNAYRLDDILTAGSQTNSDTVMEENPDLVDLFLFTREQ